jgi:hypothetical protein
MTKWLPREPSRIILISNNKRKKYHTLIEWTRWWGRSAHTYRQTENARCLQTHLLKNAHENSQDAIISAHSVRKYRTEHRKTRTILCFGGLLCANTLFVVHPSAMYLGEAMSFGHMHSLVISHHLGNVSPVTFNFKYMKRVLQGSHCRSDLTPIRGTFTRSPLSMFTRNICNAPQFGSDLRIFHIFFIFRAVF